MNRSAFITADYAAQYPDPVDVVAGTIMRVEREDPEFRGWWWCAASDGRCGWVPAPLLDRVPAAGEVARLRKDYSGRELSVTRGERVWIVDEHAAWLLVRTDNGATGWIPASHAALDVAHDTD